MQKKCEPSGTILFCSVSIRYFKSILWQREDHQRDCVDGGVIRVLAVFDCDHVLLRIEKQAYNPRGQVRYHF
jgi:hypothetical protein